MGGYGIHEILFYFAEFLKNYQLFMLKISEAQSKL
jgi:hypothetical protein